MSSSATSYPVRTLFLVDVENLVGHGRLTAQEVATARSEVAAIRPIADQDLVIIGSHPGNVIAAGQGWPGARYVCRRGSDGADLALLEVVAYENVHTRFTQIVIASGDGIFSYAAAYLASTGCHVSIVGSDRRCSHLLWRGTKRVDLIPDRTSVRIAA